MSECTITVTIGGKEIRLDPGTDIAAKNPTPLAKTLSANDLRVLYSQLKDNLTLKPVLTSFDKDLINNGKTYYEQLLQQAELAKADPDADSEAMSGKFLTVLKAISTETDINNLQALTAYAKSLNAKETLAHGNFMIDPKDAHKTSPYSMERIRKMVFKGDGDKVKLFDQLVAFPGMNALKLSVAYATLWNDEAFSKVKGAYISPDNIVQIVIPYTKEGYHRITESTENLVPVTESNIGNKAKNEIQDVLIHEVMHALYSELYNADPEFAKSIDELHDLLKLKQPKIYAKYKDVHELIASVFNDAKLQSALSAIPVSDRADITLMDVFVNALAEKKQVANPTLLRSFISLVGSRLPNLAPVQRINLTALREMIKDDRNIFFLSGVDEADIDENMSPRDQSDSYYGNNRKAFYTSKRFDTKWGTNSFVRDSYYKGTINSPTKERIDRLQGDDVVIVPWLRYVKADKVNKQKGRWQEVGILVDKDGKSILDAKGKDQIVDIIRDDKGKIKQPEVGTIKEMTQGFPVMYANVDKKQVVLAKTNLKELDEFAKLPGRDKDGKATAGKFNTVSLPYNLVKGIRELDKTYFDHNDNYIAQLEEATKKLKEYNAEGIKADATIEGRNDELFDNIQFFTRRVDQLEKAVQRAADVKAEMQYYYNTYAFSKKIGDKYYMNVDKADYIGSTYDKSEMDKREFAKIPVFRLLPSKYKTKDNKDKFYTQPSNKLFDIFWDADTGKEFAKSSEQMSEAVSKGDLVRVRTQHEFNVLNSKDKVKVRMGEWMTVYKRVGNGILACTAEGKGFIIPFNTIDGYAKNRATAEYVSMVNQYKAQLKDFNDDAFDRSVVNGKAVNKFTKEITHKSMKFKEAYNRKKNDESEYIESEEDAVKRFDQNLDRIKKAIKPGESFVRVAKRFTNDANEIVDFHVNALVLAKTDDALVVLTENRSGTTIETIKYDSTIKSNAKNGVELTFFMENSAKVKRIYEEFQAERKQYEKNKETANFERYGKGYKMLQDPRDNPHNIHNAYDFYDKVDGRSLARLGETGGIVDIKSDKFTMKKENGDRIPIYRKVVRVLDDGTVVVAEFAKTERDFGNGYKRRPGAYAQYIKPENIVRIGLNLGKVTLNEETDKYESELNQELLNRREWLWNRSKVDRDYNNFQFAASMANVKSVNSKPADKKRDYWKYIQLTNKILEPLTKKQKKANVEANKPEDYDPRPLIYLDRKFKEVPQAKAAHVMATFYKNSDTVNYVNRGLFTKTDGIGRKLALMKVGNNIRFRPELVKAVRPGDWITTKSANGDYWDAIIERTEGGDIYTLNTDFTTTKVNPARVVSVRMSKRNDVWSKFTRTPKLKELLKQKFQKDDAVETMEASKEDTKPEQIQPDIDDEEEDTDERPFSLEADYKSPKASRRALYEIGNRLQELNPQVQLNYVNQEDLGNLAIQTGYDYSRARAFVLQGQVYVNTDKASISDTIHEYAHLFLNSLKYENPALYSAVIGVTNNHSLFSSIAADYSHLGEEDLNEEVFVTVLGEYLRNKLKRIDKDNMDENKGLMLDFAQYTKDTLSKAFNRSVESVYDVAPEEILNLSWEDVINLVGDQVMNSRITDVHEVYPLTTTSDLTAIKAELSKLGFLTQQC